VFLVDDVSTDGTAHWLEDTLKPVWGSRLKYLQSSKPLGVSRARNWAIGQSDAEWVALLDSDDQWEPTKLEKQWEWAQQFPHIPLCHTEETWWRGEKLLLSKKKHRKSGGFIFEKCLALCVISPSASFIKRSLFDEVGGFREDFPVCEDYELWLRITSRYEVGFLPEALTIKNGGHSDQLSHQYSAMDYWRAKALHPYLSSSLLSQNAKKQVAQTLSKKCEILMNGYIKHNNLKHYEQVKNWKSEAQSLLEFSDLILRDS